MANPLEITIRSDEGVLVWQHGNGRGVTSASYAADGTLADIIAALMSALEFANFELRGLQEVDAIPNIGGAPAKIDHNIPVVVAGN